MLTLRRSFLLSLIFVCVSSSAAVMQVGPGYFNSGVGPASNGTMDSFVYSGVTNPPPGGSICLTTMYFDYSSSSSPSGCMTSVNGRHLLINELDGVKLGLGIEFPMTYSVDTASVNTNFLSPWTWDFGAPTSRDDAKYINIFVDGYTTSDATCSDSPTGATYFDSLSSTCSMAETSLSGGMFQDSSNQGTTVFTPTR